MNTTAPTRPAHLRSRRVQLPTGPAAAPQARHQVEAALRSWDIPADPDTATLLTSELITNAIRHETGPAVTLLITCSRNQLRIEVHDSSPLLPRMTDAPADAETGRGLLLVATLAAEWGVYRTPAGKAVYFTLTFQPGPTPVNGAPVNGASVNGAPPNGAPPNGAADQRSTTCEVIT